MIIKRNTCRICGSSLEDILNLGEMHIPSYINDDGDGFVNRKCPLILSQCSQDNEKVCGLIQLRHTVYSDILYDEYYYQSCVNEHMKLHLKKIVDDAVKFLGRKINIAIDIGANDGTLCRFIQQDNNLVYAFEPSYSLKFHYGENKNIILINDYFNADSYLKLQNKKADIITSIAMFYDLENPNKFISDINKVLSDDGIWVSEQSYLPLMLSTNSFDTICHEHLEYYSFITFKSLIQRHGMYVVGLEFNTTNGGSFRTYVSRNKNLLDKFNFYRIYNTQVKEFNSKLDQIDVYVDFEKRIISNRNKILDFLNSLKQSSKKIFLYGASTKGSVTLQYYGINSNLIPYCADRNCRKWGKKIVGTDISIISEKEARWMKPDFFFVLPWHFIDGFIEREKDFLQNGGKFIVPMPYPRIISKDNHQGILL